MNQVRVIACLAVAAAFVFSGCSTLSVDSEKDPQANLAGYSTYAWKEAPPRDSARAGQPPNDMLDRKIRGAVDQELSAIGVASKPSDPDLYFVYYADVSESTTRSNGGVAIGAGIPTPGPFSVGVGTSTAGRAYTVREGKLTLDAVDAKTGKTVWRGVATGSVDGEGTNDAKIRDAVGELIGKFEDERKGAESGKG